MGVPHRHAQGLSAPRQPQLREANRSYATPLDSSGANHSRQRPYGLGC